MTQVRYKYQFQRKWGKSISGQENYIYVEALVRSQAIFQQLLCLVTWNPYNGTMGYYQRVRGNFLPVRAHWALSGYNVGARSLRGILEYLHWVEWTPSRPPYDTLSHCKMSAMPQEEKKKKRRKAVVPLLLLKISLVKFSLSQRQAAQTLGLQGVRGRTGGAGKKKKGTEREWAGGRVKQKDREWANSPSKAGLGTSYVFERLANRSLFLISKMKAAWAKQRTSWQLVHSHGWQCIGC